MKKIILLSIFAMSSLTANAIEPKLTEFCGKLLHVSNHEFSYGFLSVIAIEAKKNRPIPEVLIYDERDILGVIETLKAIEPGAKRASSKKINFSEDESEDWGRYQNFQFHHDYQACVLVDTSLKKIKFEQASAFKLYLNSDTGVKILYSRQ